MPTISLTLIVKNEEENMIRLLPQVKGFFDEMVIVDTGSTDKTIEVCKSHGAIVYELDAMEDVYGTGELEFNFGKARQHAVDMATSDWVMWLDADDRVEGLENLQELMTMDKRLWFCRYYTWKDEKDKYIVFSQRERLWKKGTALWQFFIHENATPNGHLEKGIDWDFTDLVTVYHIAGLHDLRESGERNLLRIKKYCDSMGDKAEPRYFNLLADSYYATSKWQEAIDAYKKYFQIETNAVPDAIYQCVLNLADSYAHLDMFHEAINELLSGAVMGPTRPEAYCLMGSIYLMQKNWNAAIHWISIGLQQEPPIQATINNSAIYTYSAWAELGFAFAQIGEYEKALQAYQTSVSFGEPIDAIQKDIKTAEMLLRQDYAVKAYLELYKTVESLEPSKLGHLMKSVPKPFNEDPRIKALKV